MVASFVLDTSVTIAWCFGDEATPGSQALLDALPSRAAVVPPLWRWEIGNALLAAERRQRIAPVAADRFLQLLQQLPIHVDAEATARALDETRRLARAHGLTTYDAAYLEMAQRLQLPLATRDQDLARAATAAGIQLLPT